MCGPGSGTILKDEREEKNEKDKIEGRHIEHDLVEHECIGDHERIWGADGVVSG